MFNNATVTMPYAELQGLLNDINTYKEKLAVIEDAAKYQPSYKEALDKIFNLLDAASKETEALHKQKCIYECMCIYCDAFSIPRQELMQDVPDGEIVDVKTPKKPRRAAKYEHR